MAVCSNSCLKTSKHLRMKMKTGAGCSLSCDLDILDYKYGGHVFDQYGVIEKIDESSTVPEFKAALDEEETYQANLP